MNATLRRYWPLFLAISFIWSITVIVLFISIRQNQGHLVYGLDDAYIHMAMAKNFSQYGVWGVCRDWFASSSSSLFWTLILSLIYFLFGVNETAPLLLNIFFGTALLWFAYSILVRYHTPSFFSAVVLLLILFAAPMPFLVFSGMEHLSHAFFSLAFLYLAGRALANEDPQDRRKYTPLDLGLLLLSPFVVMLRLEGLFLVFSVCMFFVFRKRFLYACSLGVLASSPVIINGLVSISQGWFFLPNSVLLKGKQPDLTSSAGFVDFVYSQGYRYIMTTPHILVLVIAALVLFIIRYDKQKGLWEERQVMLSVFVVTTFLHMQFSKAEQYRYEAYLLVLGLVTLGAAWPEKFFLQGPLRIAKCLTAKSVAILLLLFMVSLPLIVRSGRALFKTPLATTNIYDQQYQMGLFFKKFYRGQAVAANDIGAINFLGEIKCLDLWGLANVAVAKARRRGDYNSQKIHALAVAEKVKAVVVYDNWFKVKEKFGIPSQWVKVGEWEIANNVIAGHSIVSFYAVDSDTKDVLIGNLKKFAAQLPATVKQYGTYVDGPDSHGNG